MSNSTVNPNPYPFQHKASATSVVTEPSDAGVTVQFKNCRGNIPSIQASRLRGIVNEAHGDPSNVVATVCSYDALSSRLCEEAGFPMIFLAGYAMASSFGLPDTGYIAFQEVVAKVQEVSRQVTIPICVDGDTGYGSPMNVRRTVQGFAAAGAAGIMIEDQTWPKRCGHTTGKSVVSRTEAYARWQAAVDARNEGQDIWILARTDSLIHGYEEALTRARKAIEIGVDAIFVEALPDRASMERLRQDLQFPVFANIIEGGKTEELSAQELAKMGYSVVAYPWTLVAAKLKSVRDALENIKKSMSTGRPPVILTYDEVCHGVGFDEYYELEERYEYEGRTTGANGHQWSK